ncbi:hypothetical protein B6U91_01020 [Candidatus Pacearchaeota archaeon ex4484_71]|nr:MAG: hypothetical protein B6U91_01020 [Candidatus Pacearchaeota archaeon ex4484_71]
MKEIAWAIKNMLDLAEREDLKFFGRRPSMSRILRELENFERYKKTNTFQKGRTPLALIFPFNEEIVGYCSFLILDNARATPHEKEFIDMGNGLNYLYFKKLFVHPEYRRKGMGNKLVESGLKIASEIHKYPIVDLDKDDYISTNIFMSHGFREDYRWISRTGREMIRFFPY